MVVMKFGGTSVGTAEALERLVDIVRRERERASTKLPGPVVVVSALSGVTDGLIALTEAAAGGHKDTLGHEVEALRDRHLDLAAPIRDTTARDELTAVLHGEIDDLARRLGALAVLREASPRSRDGILAVGELLSSHLVAARLADAGLPARSIDARRVLVTDDSHTAALPQIAPTAERLRAEVLPCLDRGVIPVLGGFIGATAAGITTTLGRGGSDYSASLVGAGLGVSEIQIWTDVDGMLTADPRVVRDARIVETLTFGEAAELAYFGAKVLHPSTITPAISADIPVRILNARRPTGAGTLITAEAARQRQGLAAIACKRGITVVDVTSHRMLMAYGFLHRVFEAFARYETPVDVVTTSEVSVSVTIDQRRGLPEIERALREFAGVASEPGMAIVCAVGDGLRTDPALAGRVLGALEGLPVRMVSQASTRRNITMVLPESSMVEAMERLHGRFFRSCVTPPAATAEEVEARR